MSLFEQPIRVGDSKYVHARSAFYADETRCGLEQTVWTPFRETTEDVTCRFCKSAKAS